jgi:predicted small lipoprotein YifL
MAVVGALVAALGLAACGRKGPLDAPPYSGSVPNNLRAAPAATPSPGSPVEIQGRARSSAPNQTFILDALID